MQAGLQARERHVNSIICAACTCAPKTLSLQRCDVCRLPASVIEMYEASLFQNCKLCLEMPRLAYMSLEGYVYGASFKIKTCSMLYISLYHDIPGIASNLCSLVYNMRL